MDKSSASLSRVVEWRCFQSGGAVADAVTKCLRVTQHGVELHHAKSPVPHEDDDDDASEDDSERRSAVSVVTKKQQQPATPKGKAYAVHEFIPWQDVLGAIVLDSSDHAAALVPGYTAPSSSEKGVEFAVFACIPKPKAPRWRGVVFGSKFDAFSCFGRSGEAASTSDGGGNNRSSVSNISSISKANSVNEAPPATSTPATTPQERVLVQWVFRYTDDDAAAYATRTVRAIQRLADPRVAHSLKPATGKELPQLSRRVRPSCHLYVWLVLFWCF